MKSYSSLSWREKAKIRDGEVSSLDYQSGHSWRTKTKVEEGKKKKKNK